MYFTPIRCNTYFLTVLVILICAYETETKSGKQQFLRNDFRQLAKIPHNRRGQQNDGDWFCSWQLSGFSCKDGHFNCQCGRQGDRNVRYKIGCKYKFPGCGVIVHKTHNCDRFYNCAVCRTDIGEWDKNACQRCKPGFVFGTGDCKQDLNECTIENGGCEHGCVNTYGSYYCTCNDGHQLQSDRHKCKRLACENPGRLAGGSVVPTDNWLYQSYAKYQCDGRTVTVGHSVRKCLAKGVNLWWNYQPPTCEDTCDTVNVGIMTSCGRGDLTKEECEQLGCCYRSNQNGTTCFQDNKLNYIRYGNERPKQKEGFVIQPESTEEGCNYLCLTDRRCKSYAIQRTFKDVLQHRNCHLYANNREFYAKRELLVKDIEFDFFDVIESPR